MFRNDLFFTTHWSSRVNKHGFEKLFGQVPMMSGTGSAYVAGTEEFWNQCPWIFEHLFVMTEC